MLKLRDAFLSELPHPFRRYITPRGAASFRELAVHSLSNEQMLYTGIRGSPHKLCQVMRYS